VTPEDFFHEAVYTDGLLVKFSFQIHGDECAALEFTLFAVALQLSDFNLFEEAHVVVSGFLEFLFQLLYYFFHFSFIR